jgi:methionyl-tRNA formyltransferase
VGHGLILFLGPADSPVLEHLHAVGETVVRREAPITPADVEALAPAWAVSHGYRHILRAAVLATLPGRFLNLHISLLPYNRGADPNLWSWLDDTPKGVTLHLIDEGVDTGPVIAQRELDLPDTHTLATSYAALQEAMVELFAAHWPAVAAGRVTARPQRGEGTLHRMADRAAVEALLTAGWDTPVHALRGRHRPATRQATRSAP